MSVTGAGPTRESDSGLAGTLANQFAASCGHNTLRSVNLRQKQTTTTTPPWLSLLSWERRAQ